MKANKREYVICILFCGFLAVMSILYFALPQKDFSETEKRYLADFPKPVWEDLSSGKFGTDMETYMADHIPGRDFFVGLNAYTDLLTGRQIAKDIYVVRNQRLVEAPVKENPAAVEKNMNAINQFAEKAGVPVDLMLVPSAGWAVQRSVIAPADSYHDEEIIRDIYSHAGNRLSCIDLASHFAGFSDLPDMYYRTDHHWTSLGAYRAYQYYMAQKGMEYRPQEMYTIETHGGFHGSTYSRSALWLTPAEEIEMWHGSDGLICSNEDKQGQHDGPFYTERLEEADQYTVFLDGNHSLVRIHNPAAAGKGNLLVIRDSYSNCLGAFLAESYENVILADLRYYKEPLAQLCETEHIDSVLVCYSLSNFMTDSNIVWLAQ